MYADDILYCSLTGGWMEIKFNIPLQQYTTMLLTSIYIKHKCFASVATKYSLAYNYIITFTTCFGQRRPSSDEHYTTH
jgi:hypothetical protein